jgi:hypothetical protein
MWRNYVAKLFIAQNSIVSAFSRPQPNRQFAEEDRASHPLDLYLPCMLRPTKTDERMKALSYQLDNMLVHQFLSRLISSTRFSLMSTFSISAPFDAQRLKPKPLLLGPLPVRDCAFWPTE